MAPETLYAKTFDDVWIAYQVVGNNSPDIVLVNSWVSHLEIMWEQPLFRSMLEALSGRRPHRASLEDPSVNDGDGQNDRAENRDS